MSRERFASAHKAARDMKPLPPLPPCKRCGHSPDWHRLDDSTNVSPTDPDAKFRCIGYDCEAPGPWPDNACDCPDYVEAPARVGEGDSQ
jgi:hypothetical protein